MPKGIPARDRSLHGRSWAAQAGRDPRQIITLARSYTAAALRKIVDLMNGKGGKATVLNADGIAVEVDIEVPAAVQLKAAELVIERGYGKSPQAIILQDDTAAPDMLTAIPIAERIIAIKAARDAAGQVTDLEASQQLTIELPVEKAEDMI